MSQHLVDHIEEVAAKKGMKFGTYVKEAVKQKSKYKEPKIDL